MAFLGGCIKAGVAQGLGSHEGAMARAGRSAVDGFKKGVDQCTQDALGSNWAFLANCPGYRTILGAPKYPCFSPRHPAQALGYLSLKGNQQSLQIIQQSVSADRCCTQQQATTMTFQ